MPVGDRKLRGADTQTPAGPTATTGWFRSLCLPGRLLLQCRCHVSYRPISNSRPLKRARTGPALLRADSVASPTPLYGDAPTPLRGDTDNPPTVHRRTPTASRRICDWRQACYRHRRTPTASRRICDWRQACYRHRRTPTASRPALPAPKRLLLRLHFWCGGGGGGRACAQAAAAAAPRLLTQQRVC